jgi:uncharacterized protein YutE (UPF0331/DUF86 family)
MTDGPGPLPQSRLDQLRDAEQHLRRLRDLGRHAVRGDVDRLNSARYLVVLAVEIGVEAGLQVIASDGLRSPGSYEEVFTELGRGGALSTDLAASLASLARLRNLLVHGDADVGEEIVLDVLHGDTVDDLARLRGELSRALSVLEAHDTSALVKSDSTIGEDATVVPR